MGQLSPTGRRETAMALTGRDQGHQFRRAVPGRVPPGPPGPPPDRPRRLRNLLVGLATFLAAGGITAAVMLIAHPLPRGAAPSPSGTVSAPSSPAARSSSRAAPQAAAQGLAG